MVAVAWVAEKAEVAMAVEQVVAWEVRVEPKAAAMVEWVAAQAVAMAKEVQVVATEVGAKAAREAGAKEAD
jgi:hypothetical protein